MSDPYTEATRHERKRMPTFAKVLLVAGGLMAAAFVAFVFVAAMFLKRQAEELAVEWQDDIDFEFFDSDATTAEAVANAADALFGGEVQISESDLDLSAPNRFEVDLSGINRSDWDLSGLDLSMSNLDGQEINFDFSELGESLRDIEPKLEELVEEAVEKGVEFEGNFEGNDGWLTISCRECRSSLEVRGNEDGGSLRIRSASGNARVDLGDNAARLPRWVPTYPRARMHKRLFSGEKDGFEFGGALHTTGAETERVYNWYEENVDADRLGATRSITKWNGRRERGTLRTIGGDRELFLMMWKNTKGNTSIVTMHKTKR